MQTLIQHSGFKAICVKKISPKNSSILTLSEPIGSVPPKVSMDDELKSARVLVGNSLSLKCPGQAYPIPVYR